MPDYAAMSKKAADILAAQLILKPDCVLGLATGSTPEGLYRCLVERYESGELDFSAMKSFNLDEYAGLPPEHEQSYRYFMQKNLLDHVNIDPANTHVPKGLTNDPKADCMAYEQAIAAAGGIDIQLLGIGHNGHIGFNEPCDSFILDTHEVALSEKTIAANTRFFGSADEVPKKAYTMGIRTIMHARKVLMVVSGKEKAEAVKAAFFGPVTPQVPASVLQLHPDMVLVCDEAALDF